ncbi:putative secreted protein [Saccharothrix espanaensis DSM 44229]|uniref:Putative secreted protein n=1 Tax=Saccharothrix espanaensis (strain ATCC 51144 / DSM 44229 / JCM 9112 / NBRC 15066 / NRRL 15764) TaxID=1179773 RepID=K0JZI7_SACES|nr:putative secreted protein [Saccharothrix espanaensis DSM 44229]
MGAGVLQNVRGLGVAVIVSVWVVVAVDVVFAAWDWLFLFAVDEPDPVLSALMDGVNAVWLVSGPAAVILVVAWLWQARSAVEGSPHRYGQRWVVWGWLPVVGLWVPRRVVADVWAASAPPPERARRSVVNWWWGLWLLYDLGTNAHFLVSILAVSDPDTMRTVVRFGAVFPVVAAGAAACLTVVVRRISSWQDVSTVERAA